jgi:hypothetical protein
LFGWLSSARRLRIEVNVVTTWRFVASTTISCPAPAPGCTERGGRAGWRCRQSGLVAQGTPYAADWDGDGKPDIIGSSADGKVWWWRNLGAGHFAKRKVIRMPAVCYSPTAAAGDWNGDGDLDLLVSTAYGYTCWFDRSFLEHGYAVAERVPARKR